MEVAAVPKTASDAVTGTLAAVDDLQSQLHQLLSLADEDVIAELPPLRRARAFLVLAQATSALFYGIAAPPPLLFSNSSPRLPRLIILQLSVSAIEKQRHSSGRSRHCKRVCEICFVLESNENVFLCIFGESSAKGTYCGVLSTGEVKHVP